MKRLLPFLLFILACLLAPRVAALPVGGGPVGGTSSGLSPLFGQMPCVFAQTFYQLSDGADGSGRPDTSLSVSRAVTSLGANGGCVWISPRSGGYSWRTAVTLPTTSKPVAIIAPYDAAAIVPDKAVVSASTLLTIQGSAGFGNAFTLRGLYFVGNAVGTDAAQIIATSSDAWVAVEQCAFLGLQTTADMLAFTVAKLDVQESEFYGNNASGNSWMIVQGGVWGIGVHRNLFGTGTSGVTSKSTGADTIIRLRGDNPATQAQGVRIDYNDFRDGTRCVWVDPIATFNVDYIELVRNEFVANLSLPFDAHDANDVRLVGNQFAANAFGPFASIQTRATGNVDTWIADQNEYHFGPPFIAADLAGVRYAKLSRSQGFAAGIGVTLRAGVHDVYLEDNDGQVTSHLTIAVAGANVSEKFSGQWYSLSTFGVRFIDPANSSGFASDNNTGATNNNVPAGSGPILSTAHLNSILYGRKLPGNVTITYMSDDLSGTRLNRSAFSANGFTLTFQGTPQTLHTGGTINASTHQINPATNQRESIKTSDLANFSPFVFINGGAAAHPSYVQDTTGGNAGTFSWIVSTNGDPTLAAGTRPVKSDFATAGTIASGDSYVIKRGSVLLLDSTVPDTGNANGGVTALFQDFAFGLGSAGSAAATNNVATEFIRCSFEDQFGGGGSFMVASFVAAGIGVTSPITFLSGGAYNTLFADYSNLLTLGGDTYVTGYGLIIGTNNHNDVQVNDDIGVGVQVQDTTNATAGIIVMKNANLGAGNVLGGSGVDAKVWGLGNAGVGLAVASGSVKLAATAAVQATVTGAGGDFGFIAPNGASTDLTAWSFDEAGAGTYVNKQATTWANFNNAGAGKFQFHAHYPATQSSLVAF